MLGAISCSPTVRMIALSVILAPAMIAQPIHVDDDVAGGNGSGDSWQNAISDLSPVLDAATPGTEAWVAKGTYVPNTPVLIMGDMTDSRFSFKIPSGVHAYGGFRGGPNGELTLDDRRACSTVRS